MNLPKPMLAAFLFLLAACDSHELDPAVDRVVLDKIRNRIMAAENAGDASIFEEVAAADVVVMPPGAPPMNGRDAAADAMRGYFGQFDMRITYASQGISVRDGVAIDRGTYEQTTVPKSGGQPAAAQSSSSKGSYLWVYQRTDDGRWLQSHVIWNVD